MLGINGQRQRIVVLMSVRCCENQPSVPPSDYRDKTHILQDVVQKFRQHPHQIDKGTCTRPV